MAIRTHFDSLAGTEQVRAMEVEEGMRMVLSQIDAVLTGTPAWGHSSRLRRRVESDTRR